MIYVILIILSIICLIVYKKKLLNEKFRSILILLTIILIMVVAISLLIINIPKIVLFFKSQEYKEIDNYDYSRDIENLGYISEEGAIKIAKEKTESETISDVSCELSKDNSYWKINLTAGWCEICGHPKEWYFEIDYNTGEILDWSVTK